MKTREEAYRRLSYETKAKSDAQRQELLAVQEQVRHAKAVNTDTDNEHKNHLKCQIENLKKQLDKVNVEKRQAETDRGNTEAELRSEIEAYYKSRATVKELKAKLNGRDNELASLRPKHTTTEKDNERLRARILVLEQQDGSSADRKQNERLAILVKELQHKLESSVGQETYDRLAARNEELEQKVNSSTVQHDKVKTGQQALIQLMQQKAESSVGPEEHERLTARVQELDQEWRTLTHQKADLQGQLTESRREHAAAEDELNDLRVQHKEDGAVKIAPLESHIQQLRGQLEETTQSLVTIANIHTECPKDHEGKLAMEHGLEALRAEHRDDIEAEIVPLEVRVQELLGQVDEQAKEAAALAEQLETLSADKQARDLSFAELQRQHNGLLFKYRDTKISTTHSSSATSTEGSIQSAVTQSVSHHPHLTVSEVRTPSVSADDISPKSTRIPGTLNSQNGCRTSAELKPEPVSNDVTPEPESLHRQVKPTSVVPEQSRTMQPTTPTGPRAASEILSDPAAASQSLGISGNRGTTLKPEQRHRPSASGLGDSAKTSPEGNSNGAVSHPYTLKDYVRADPRPLCKMNVSKADKEDSKGRHECWRCSEQGHVAKECFKWKAQEQYRAIRRQYGNVTGGIAEVERRILLGLCFACGPPDHDHENKECPDYQASSLNPAAATFTFSGRGTPGLGTTLSTPVTVQPPPASAPTNPVIDLSRRPSRAPRQLTALIDRYPHVPRVELDERIANNLCYFCGGTGHSDKLWNCPSRHALRAARRFTNTGFDESDQSGSVDDHGSNYRQGNVANPATQLDAQAAGGDSVRPSRVPGGIAEQAPSVEVTPEARIANSVPLFHEPQGAPPVARRPAAASPEIVEQRSTKATRTRDDPGTGPELTGTKESKRHSTTLPRQDESLNPSRPAQAQHSTQTQIPTGVPVPEPTTRTPEPAPEPVSRKESEKVTSLEAPTDEQIIEDLAYKAVPDWVKAPKKDRVNMQMYKIT